MTAICQQHSRGSLRGIPSPGVIRLTRDGDVVAEGPITTAQDEVARAALLLTDLLSDFDSLPEYRASGALRLALARALGTMDLPPYVSLDEFCTALSRFATEDVRDVAQGLFTAWERARAGRAFKIARNADLTISDVRRARRATGLSLGYLASVSEVPPTRLRDLEWGYMRDWPPTPEGRAQVIRYARAAGLDESIVLSIAWPMILENSAAAGADTGPGVALVRSGPQGMTVARPAVVVEARPARRQLRSALVAAAATIALLGALAMGWRSTQPDAAPQEAGQRADAQTPPPAARAAVLPPPPATADTSRGPVVKAASIQSTASPDASVRRTSPRHAAAPRSKPRRAAAPAPNEEPRKAFLERELFRIVIK